MITLKEFLEDYATSETKRVGENLIEKEINNVPNDKVREILKNNLKEIANGKRDFRF